MGRINPAPLKLRPYGAIQMCILLLYYYYCRCSDAYVYYSRRLYSRWCGYSIQSRLFVCLSVCLRSKRKTARAIDTKPCTRILYSSRSPFIDPEVKRSRSRSHSYEKRHSCSVAVDAYCYGHVLLLTAWVCMSIRLPMFSGCNSITCMQCIDEAYCYRCSM